jgi:hypothetical protein
MIRTLISAFALLLAISLAVPAGAKSFPESGHVYLSFDPHRQVSTLAVLPGEPFQLWITVDIPRVPGNPKLGIVGVEGGIALPPSVEFLEIEFPAPALNLGATFREPGLETFVVGLGECVPLGIPNTVGVLTLQLVTPGSDIEIGVAAPAVGAAAVSSFAGIGPGWASMDCDLGGSIDLVLFEVSSGPTSNVVLNSTAVPTETMGWSGLKAQFRD